MTVRAHRGGEVPVGLLGMAGLTQHLALREFGHEHRESLLQTLGDGEELRRWVDVIRLKTFGLTALRTLVTERVPYELPTPLSQRLHVPAVLGHPPTLAADGLANAQPFHVVPSPGIEPRCTRLRRSEPYPLGHGGMTYKRSLWELHLLRSVARSVERGS